MLSGKIFMSLTLTDEKMMRQLFVIEQLSSFVDMNSLFRRISEQSRA